MNLSVIWEIKLTRFGDELNLGGDLEVRIRMTPKVQVCISDSMISFTEPSKEGGEPGYGREGQKCSWDIVSS